MRFARNPETKEFTRIFATLEEMIVEAADAVRPPERLTVSQAAARYRYLNNPGSYVGPWKNEKTPYLVEPMDTLTSLDYTAMILVAPARTGKSDCFFNWLDYTAICDPADMMIVHMTQSVGRNWSLGDLEKNLYIEGDHKRPTALGKRLVPGRVNDNVFDKKFMSGMRLLISHPTPTELSGKTIPRLWVNDADNMVLDVEGKGSPFALAKKRAQTFRRHGMTVAEGSPAHDIVDSKWIRSTPHEFPPCPGLGAEYNGGDRRRWYWRCPKCDHAFEGDFSLLQWDDLGDEMRSAKTTRMVCPHCSGNIDPDRQYDLNLGGKWIKEGQIWLPNGHVVGEARESDIASFWLKGPAAAFTTWDELVLKYLRALNTYEKTGDEGPLKATTNTDQGLPYRPKQLESARLPDELRARAEDYGCPDGDLDAEKVVPAGIRFLTAMIDVQAGSKPCFVVHVFGMDMHCDIWHVDMFKIKYSPSRMVDDGHPHLIDPASYPEDWDAITDQVLNRTYPLADGSGRRMMIHLVACDSGGGASDDDGGKSSSVTESAYRYYTKLRSEQKHGRFLLLKGAPSRTNTLPLRLSKADQSNLPAKLRGIIGDVPIWLVNSNSVKDMAANRLSRLDPGGMIHFPQWAPEWLYMQLTSEVRTDRGWVKVNRRAKNESFDLLAYAVACNTHRSIQLDKIDWSSPPLWAEEWDKNSLVLNPNQTPSELANARPKPKLTLQQLKDRMGS